MRRSKEEMFLAQIERETRKAERLARQAEKVAEKVARKKDKEQPTEMELVHKYVNRVINNQKYHGRVDNEKFQGIAYDTKVSKNLWNDDNFYFSVVFESSDQKHLFLDAIGLTEEEINDAISGGKVNIVNGIKFAAKLGVTLVRERSRDYPVANLDLLPFVLDNETLE